MAESDRPSSHGIGFAEAARTWARIALLSFGGPAGQIAVMHRILVDEKKWVGEGRFLHALNFCMLLPGPEAQQLATYLGWLMHGVRGGLVAGALFVAPGLVAIMALSWIYALYGGVGAVAALFFGLKAAVLAIVFQAVARIAGRALGSRAKWAVAGAAFVALFFFAAPFPLVVLTAGLIGYAAGRAGSTAFAGGAGHGAKPGATSDADSALGVETPAHARTVAFGVPLTLLLLWLVPVALLVLTLGQANVFSTIATFFSQMAVVTFGGAYAVLVYVAQEAVETYRWLTPTEMLDGLGLAETTPGPLIMVTQFVGFLGAYRNPGALPPLAAGTLGGLLTTWVTFLPCFLWIFLGAPFIERLRGNRALAGALAAITAAVVGVILNLAIWFALHFLFGSQQLVATGPLAFEVPVPASLDWQAALLAAAAVVAVFRFKASPLAVLAACAIAGLALKTFI